MKVLIQRVSSASVTVDGSVIGRVERGLLLLTGFGHDDNLSKLKPMAEKVANLRIFSDDEGKFNHSVREIRGGVLVVPQFTLYADTSKGRRPEFFGALDPRKARVLFEDFVKCFPAAGIQSVQTGEFGSHMLVELENDGPVTIMLES